jgi:hypothetical protein
MSATDNEDEQGGLSPLARAALEYAHRGWRVLPIRSVQAAACTCGQFECPSPGTHPYLPDGVKGASCDEGTVRGFWATYPDANVAIATGPDSGIIVVDVDGPEGVADIAELEAKLGPLPLTPKSRTGGGGLHYFFSSRSAHLNRNRVRVGGRKIDVRSAGGYVVASPSIHASGTAYSWEVSPEQVEPAELTPAWLDFLASTADSRRQLRTCFSDLVGTTEGGRHDALTRVVGIALRNGVDPIDVEVAALACAATFDPPLPQVETRRIVADLARKDAEREAALADAVASEDGWVIPTLFDEVELPDFPPDVFPDWIDDFVRALALATQTPRALPAMLALAVLATACAKRYEVRLHSGYAEPLNLFIAVGLGPGNRKSAVFSQVVRPLMRREAELNRMFPRDDGHSDAAAARRGQRDPRATVKPYRREPPENRRIQPRGRGLRTDGRAILGPGQPRRLSQVPCRRRHPGRPHRATHRVDHRAGDDDRPRGPAPGHR